LFPIAADEDEDVDDVVSESRKSNGVAFAIDANKQNSCRSLLPLRIKNCLNSTIYSGDKLMNFHSVISWIFNFLIAYSIFILPCHLSLFF
jgi:hypothetical protein